jgi:Fe-S-cluster formation regulator IscX/YfhJ
MQSEPLVRYVPVMSTPYPLIEDDEAAAEARALAAAIADSDADPRTVPHEDVRAWLLRLANGDFDAPPPQPR